jgi:A/G-specific adenine glycosylase
VLLGVLRDADGAVPRDRLLAAWSADPVQAERALASLLADGLVRSDADGLRL